MNQVRVWDRSGAFYAVVSIPLRVQLKPALPVRDHMN